MVLREVKQKKLFTCKIWTRFFICLPDNTSAEKPKNTLSRKAKIALGLKRLDVPGHTAFLQMQTFIYFHFYAVEKVERFYLQHDPDETKM